jgi:hypothetical protein
MLRIKRVLPALLSFTLVAISASGQVAPIKPGLAGIFYRRFAGSPAGSPQTSRQKTAPVMSPARWLPLRIEP